jgi:hypothetical protein
VIPVLSLYESWYPAIISWVGHSAITLLILKGLLATAAVLIPTAAMGGTLPVLAELVDGDKGHLGLNVEWLYAVNTAGAALGAMTGYTSRRTGARGGAPGQHLFCDGEREFLRATTNALDH